MYFEGNERFGGISEISSSDVDLEQFTPGEVNLASADRLIEHLEALGELPPPEKEKAEQMIKDLKLQIKFFEDEKLTIPPQLPFAVSELERLIRNEPISFRDLIEIKEGAPDDPAVIEANDALKVLERLANPNPN